MAALHGMGIDNCRVEVDGPEIPILDGSAAPFVCLVHEAGVKVQRAGKRWLVVEQAVEIRDGDKVARLEPSDAFSVEFTADFAHPLITNQGFRVTLNDRVFEREVARARTFCFLRDIERMQAAGLAKGGSLENAIVVDEFSILNPEGLRYPDEFARHKVLDAIGDLALFGLPVLGALTAVKSGHAMNQALVKKVLADPASHRVVRVSAEAEAPRARTVVPALAAREGGIA
jgi:UDP-3-O-[3-hydroxymyristoyl] N-acetylglucosamine deacetylase